MIALGLTHLVVSFVAGGGLGFGAGRIHSKKTVSAIEGAVKTAGTDVVSGVKDVAGDIKKKL